MKVKIGDFYLSNGDKESPNNLEPQESRSVQTTEGLRWEKVKTFDRKNAKTQITFSVTRSHDTISDAQRFILLHGPTVPTSGLVQFILEDNSIVLMDAESCACQTVSSKLIGLSTTHNYTLVGGTPVPKT